MGPSLGSAENIIDSKDRIPGLLPRRVSLKFSLPTKKNVDTDMCGMMLIIDMRGMIYANNLLKNPATKRLSGKNVACFWVVGMVSC